MLLLILASLFLSVSSKNTGAHKETSPVTSPVPQTAGNQTSAVTQEAINSSGEGPAVSTIPVTWCDSCGKANHTALQGLLKEVWCIVKQPRVYIAFLTGILLSATVYCLARTCTRKKRRSENLAENVEMVTTESGALIDDGQAVEFNDGTHDQAAEAAGTSAPDGDQELKEVEYSNIMFGVSQCSLTEARDAQDPTETEYAEIKKGAPEDRQDDGGEGGEVLEDNREGEEEMLEEELETGLSVSAEEEGEDGEVYSKVP